MPGREVKSEGRKIRRYWLLTHPKRSQNHLPLLAVLRKRQRACSLGLDHPPWLAKIAAVSHLRSGETLQPDVDAPHGNSVAVEHANSAGKALASSGGQGKAERQDGKKSEHMGSLAQPERERPSHPFWRLAAPRHHGLASGVMEQSENIGPKYSIRVGGSPRLAYRHREGWF